MDSRDWRELADRERFHAARCGLGEVLSSFSLHQAAPKQLHRLSSFKTPQNWLVQMFYVIWINAPCEDPTNHEQLRYLDVPEQNARQWLEMKLLQMFSMTNSSRRSCVLLDMSTHETRFRFASDYYKMEAVRFKKLSRSALIRTHIFESQVLPSFVLAAAIFQFKSESGVAELSPFAVMPIPATALSVISKTKRQRLVQITRDRYMDLGQELLDNATWLLFLHC